MPFKWVKTVISKIQNFENFWDVPISYEFCHLSIFGSNAKIEETKCRHSDRMTAATDNQLNKINCSWCALKNCFFFWIFVSRSPKLFFDIFDSRNYTEGGMMAPVKF